MTIFWVRTDGTIDRATADDDLAPGPELIKVTTPPPTGGRDTWSFDTNQWVAAPSIPDQDEKLDNALEEALTIAAIKAALIGKVKAR